MPFIIFTDDLIKNYCKQPLSRVIYELETKKYNYYFQKNELDSDAFQLISPILEKMYDMGYDSTYFTKAYNSQLERLKAILEPVSVLRIISKEFLKYKSNTDSRDDLAFLEKTYLGKILSYTKIIQNLEFTKGPKNKSNKENILYHDDYAVKSIFKSLNMVFDENTIEDIFSIYYNEKPNRAITTNMNSFINWRPQGRLVYTLYGQDSDSIDQLIGFDNENSNKFISFSHNGDVSMWEITNNELTCSVNKLFNTKIEQYLMKAKASVSNNEIAIGMKNELKLYKVK